ncbi:Ig-like domain-containing protein [Microvirga sp. P5_D2]
MARINKRDGAKGMSTIVVGQGEFRVNTYTTDDQVGASVTSLKDGGFVVTWQSLYQDGSSVGVYGQRYDAGGRPVGSEFRINTYTNDAQGSPSITALTNGGFVVVWHSDGQDGFGYGVYGQRYDASGSSVGSEFRINTYTNSLQVEPSVTALTGGGFVVTWSSLDQDGSWYGVYGQRYDANGDPAGTEFRVNTSTEDYQGSVWVAGLLGGSFVVIWQSNAQDGSGGGVYGQRYNASGNPDGSEFRVNSYTASDQYEPSISRLADGSFVVTWTSDGQDGSALGVYSQRYDAEANPIGSEFRVNSYTTLDQYEPSVAARANGGFVVTWTSNGQDGKGYGVYGQCYDAAGNVAGPEFLINSYTDLDQYSPSVTGLADGSFVVAWTSNGQDGYKLGHGVYGQVFQTNDAPVVPATQKVTTAEDMPLVEVAIGATDLDGDLLTYAVKIGGRAQHGSVIFNQASHTFSYIPDADYNGSDTFTIVVSDSKGGIAEQLVTVTITPVDDVYVPPLDDSPTRDLTTTTSLTLPEGVLNVVADGSGNVQLTGNSLNNSITGNVGKNTINGGAGFDKVNGGYGNDTLYGGSGNDAFLFTTKLGTAKTDRKVNFDKIADFSVKDDSIYLDNTIFKKLGKKGSEQKPAKLDKKFFTVGDKAKDKDDYIVYNKKTGVLSYDADGAGKGQAVECALLKNKATLKFDDLFVI